MQALRSLGARQITPVIGFEDADAELTLASEAPDGKPLADLFEMGGMRVRTALKIATELAAALSALHSRRIAHGHLCPEAEADKSGDLLDPGAARRSGAERATDKIRARFGSDAIVKGRSLR